MSSQDPSYRTTKRITLRHQYISPPNPKSETTLRRERSPRTGSGYRWIWKRDPADAREGNSDHHPPANVECPHVVQHALEPAEAIQKMTCGQTVHNVPLHFQLTFLLKVRVTNSSTEKALLRERSATDRSPPDQEAYALCCLSLYQRAEHSL